MINNHWNFELTKDLDNNGVHLYATHTLQAEDVLSSVVSVHAVHFNQCVCGCGLDGDSLAVLDVGVHLGPDDPGNGTALDGGLEVHGCSSAQL